MVPFAPELERVVPERRHVRQGDEDVHSWHIDDKWMRQPGSAGTRQAIPQGGRKQTEHGKEQKIRETLKVELHPKTQKQNVKLTTNTSNKEKLNPDTITEGTEVYITQSY